MSSAHRLPASLILPISIALALLGCGATSNTTGVSLEVHNVPPTTRDVQSAGRAWRMSRAIIAPSSMDLHACPTGQTAELSSTTFPSLWARLRHGNWLIGTAFAHSEDPATHIEGPVQFDLITPTSSRISLLSPPAGAYCGLELNFKRGAATGGASAAVATLSAFLVSDPQQTIEVELGEDFSMTLEKTWSMSAQNKLTKLDVGADIAKLFEGIETADTASRPARLKANLVGALLLTVR